MDRPIVSADAQDRYERLAAQLAVEAGATPGKMMGMPTLYRGGKAFAGVVRVS